MSRLIISIRIGFEAIIGMLLILNGLSTIFRLLTSPADEGLWFALAATIFVAPVGLLLLWDARRLGRKLKTIEELPAAD